MQYKLKKIQFGGNKLCDMTNWKLIATSGANNEGIFTNIHTDNLLLKLSKDLIMTNIDNVRNINNYYHIFPHIYDTCQNVASYAKLNLDNALQQMDRDINRYSHIFLIPTKETEKLTNILQNISKYAERINKLKNINNEYNEKIQIIKNFITVLKLENNDMQTYQNKLRQIVDIYIYMYGRIREFNDICITIYNDMEQDHIAIQYNYQMQIWFNEVGNYIDVYNHKIIIPYTHGIIMERFHGDIHQLIHTLYRYTLDEFNLDEQTKKHLSILFKIKYQSEFAPDMQEFTQNIIDEINNNELINIKLFSEILNFFGNKLVSIYYPIINNEIGKILIKLLDMNYQYFDIHLDNFAYYLVDQQLTNDYRFNVPQICGKYLYIFIIDIDSLHKKSDISDMSVLNNINEGFMQDNLNNDMLDIISRDHNVPEKLKPILAYDYKLDISPLKYKFTSIDDVKAYIDRIR